MKKISLHMLFAMLLAFSAARVRSQESDSFFGVDLSADLVSRYVWRGMNLSTSPAIQPTLGLNIGNLSIGSWASYSFSPELLQEVDLFLSYETNFVSFTLNDYYNPVDTLGSAGDYFNFGTATTAHTMEGMVTLNGPESFPVSLVAGVMFYGNDRDEEGENLYSTYIELSYTTGIGGVELVPFIGITPAAGYYGESFGVVNMGIQASRNITITDKFQFPINGSLVLNPQQEKIYFVIGITL
jgi:hypothetical protein